MKAFVGLMKKDMLLARFGYIVWLIAAFLMLLGGYIFAVRADEQFIVVPFIFMALFMHVGFAPLYVLSLLRVEGKTQLWLYNPQGSIKLLLSKCATAVISLIASQVLTSIFAFIMVKVVGLQGVQNSVKEIFSVKHFAFMNGALLAGSIYLMIWVIFLWVVYHSLSHRPILRKLRWLVVILIVIASNIIETAFMRIEALRNFVMSWVVDVKYIASFSYSTGAGLESMPLEFSLPIIPIILYAGYALILFYTASLLLDKKVEV